jgi:hypothetical protein
LNNQQAGALSREKSLLERYAPPEHPVGASLSSGLERLYLPPPVQHCVDRLLDRQLGVVEMAGILRRLEGSDAAGRIPGVARFQVGAKTVKCS